MTKKQICAISIGIVIVVVIVLSVLLFGGNKDKPVNGTDDTTSESFMTDDSSSENDEDDKDNADEFPNGDSDSETTVNPDEDDKDSEDTTTPVDPDDGETSDSEDDTTEPTDPDDGDDKNSEDDTTEPTNPDDDEPEVPVHTCSYDTVKSDSSNHWYVCSCGKTANKSAHNYSNDSDTTCNTCGYTRTVATEPEKPSTIPSVSWTGGDITLGSLNVKIPTLTHFNTEALTDNTNNTFWTGNSSDTETIDTLYTTLDSIAYKLVDVNALSSKTGQGFAVENYSVKL